MKKKNWYINLKSWDEDKFLSIRNLERSYFDAELRKLPRKIPKNSTVLELGFGNGGFLKYAQEKGWEVSGAEINKDLLERAHKYGLKNIYDANQEDDLPREKFDLIVAFDVLEHISRNEIQKYLKKWGDLLHPDGYFLARFPNGDSPFGLKLQNGDPTHINFIGSGMIKAYALNAGLEIVCLSGQAEPFMISSFGHFLHRSLFVPFKLIMNKAINIIFYPNENIPFLSMNLIVVMKKINSK